MKPLFKLILAIVAFLFFLWHCVAHHDIAGAAQTSPATAVACTQDPSFAVNVRDGRVVLTGVLPDEAAREAIRVRARSLYGANGFDDQLTVSSSVQQAAWVALAPTLLPLCQRITSPASIDVRGRTVVATGQLNSEAEHTEVIQAIRAALPGEVELIDRLTVVAPAVDASVVDVPAYDGPALSATAMELQRTLDRSLFGRTIEFDISSDVIKPASFPLLNEVVAALRQWPDLRVEIQGHTDNAGNPVANQDLSARRAASVVRYLVNHGIATTKMVSRGFGQTRPIAPNTTIEGRQRNRRIQFQVVEGG
jgi:OmpA-OmpF porin, OOP family